MLEHFSCGTQWSFQGPGVPGPDYPRHPAPADGILTLGPAHKNPGVAAGAGLLELGPDRARSCRAVVSLDEEGKIGERVCVIELDVSVKLDVLDVSVKVN